MGSTMMERYCWTGEFDSDDDIEKKEVFDGDDSDWLYMNWSVVSILKCSVNLDMVEKRSLNEIMKWNQRFGRGVFILKDDNWFSSSIVTNIV